MRLDQFIFSPEMYESSGFLTDIFIYIYGPFVFHFPLSVIFLAYFSTGFIALLHNNW